MKNYGDICLINGGKVEAVDCIIGGSPCFPSGTMVFTSKGFAAIEDIRVGDLVYTHKHRFRKVIATGTHEDSVLSVKGNLSDFSCTPNHPIYSPDVSRVWNKNTRTKKFSNTCMNGDTQTIFDYESDHPLPPYASMALLPVIYQSDLRF